MIEYFVVIAILITIVAFYANLAFKNNYVEDSNPNRGRYIEIISSGISTYLGENAIAESFGNATCLGSLVEPKTVINFRSEEELDRVADELIRIGFVKVE